MIQSGHARHALVKGRRALQQRQYSSVLRRVKSNSFYNTDRTRSYTHSSKLASIISTWEYMNSNIQTNVPGGKLAIQHGARLPSCRYRTSGSEPLCVTVGGKTACTRQFHPETDDTQDRFDKVVFVIQAVEILTDHTQN